MFENHVLRHYGSQQTSSKSKMIHNQSEKMTKLYSYFEVG